jgi:pimeloyl-ACP methyl ester carboxylesterase
MRHPIADVVGQGEPLLLLSGYAVPASSLDHLKAPLAERFSVITFDYPGSGSEPVPKLPLSIPGLAAEAVRVLDHLGYRSAHVYGQSMGALVAQELPSVSLNASAALCLPRRPRAVPRPRGPTRGRSLRRCRASRSTHASRVECVHRVPCSRLSRQAFMTPRVDWPRSRPTPWCCSASGTDSSPRTARCCSTRVSPRARWPSYGAEATSSPSTIRRPRGRSCSTGSVRRRRCPVGVTGSAREWSRCSVPAPSPWAWRARPRPPGGSASRRSSPWVRPLTSSSPKGQMGTAEPRPRTACPRSHRPLGQQGSSVGQEAEPWKLFGISQRKTRLQPLTQSLPAVVRARTPGGRGRPERIPPRQCVGHHSPGRPRASRPARGSVRQRVTARGARPGRRAVLRRGSGQRPDPGPADAH